MVVLCLARAATEKKREDGGRRRHESEAGGLPHQGSELVLQQVPRTGGGGGICPGFLPSPWLARPVAAVQGRRRICPGESGTGRGLHRREDESGLAQSGEGSRGKLQEQGPWVGIEATVTGEAFRDIPEVCLQGHHDGGYHLPFELKPSSCSSEVATHCYEVLPLPNVPFFWLLFRAYSNWRALKGSERLLLLVSDCSNKWRLLVASENKNISCDSKNMKENNDKHLTANQHQSPWILRPSEELDKLLFTQPSEDGVNNCTLASICKKYHLNEKDVLKYEESM